MESFSREEVFRRCSGAFGKFRNFLFGGEKVGSGENFVVTARGEEGFFGGDDGMIWGGVWVFFFFGGMERFFFLDVDDDDG